MPSSLLPVTLLVGGCLLLGGCALPPALTVASLAADGVSYVATGKSVTDHGISAAMGEDCALLRELQGRPICSREAGHGEAAPVVAAAMAPRQPTRTVPPLAIKEAAAVRNRYVIVGSFLSAGNAARAASHYAGLGVAVLQATVGGRTFHRVVVGPLTAEQAVALKARLAAEAAVAMRVAG